MRPFGPFERMPLSVSKDCGSRICAAVRANRDPASQTHGTVFWDGVPRDDRRMGKRDRVRRAGVLKCAGAERVDRIVMDRRQTTRGPVGQTEETAGDIRRRPIAQWSAGRHHCIFGCRYRAGAGRGRGKQTGRGNCGNARGMPASLVCGRPSRRAQLDRRSHKPAWCSVVVPGGAFFCERGPTHKLHKRR